MRVAVCGSGGFIGHHLTKRLKADGHWVRGVDIKLPEYEPSPADEFKLLDLRERDACREACRAVDHVYNLAADMGGIMFITQNLADVAHNNILINAHMLDAARHNVVKKFLFSSSACVYAQGKQHDANVLPLKEEDAYPADPEPGYGWEKLFAEQLCEYYRLDHHLDVRVVRFHNCYGPMGSYEGGREKAPAAICRKVALARDGSEIEIWGDGQQTRSFMHVDDCVEGLVRLMASDHTAPLNLGTDELVTVDELVDKVSKIAGKTLVKKHDLWKPQGVRGRNSDNNKLREVLGWEPKIKLDDGLKPTYEWICSQVNKPDRFYSQFMQPGDLVFDIGANVGKKTEIFLRMGCEVVAAEPQQTCIDRLGERFGESVTICNVAVGDCTDVGQLKLSQDTGCASLNSEWIDAVTKTDRFGGSIWQGEETVPITTVDHLVELFGIPKFIKIDVEGSEHLVLAGMSRPINMCFEFHPEFLASTEKCVRRCEELGAPRFNYSLGESYEMAGEWMGGADLLRELKKFEGDNVTYGDCYVKF